MLTVTGTLPAGSGRRERLSSWSRIACSKVAQLGAWLETELVDERLASASVRLQSVRLPSGAVEREHEEPAQALPERALGDQQFELGDDLAVPPDPEIGLDPILRRRQSQLLESRDLGLRE